MPVEDKTVIKSVLWYKEKVIDENVLITGTRSEIILYVKVMQKASHRPSALKCFADFSMVLCNLIFSAYSCSVE